MRSFLIPLSIACLLCAKSPAQLCGAMPGTGQAAFGVPPPCGAVVPPAVLAAAGNPGFAIGAFAPLPPPVAGAPMLLLIGFAAPPLPLPPGLLFPPLGPGSLAMGLPIPVISFAGAAGPVPIFVPLPLPPTAAFAGMVLAAQTAVMVGGTFAISMGTSVML
jgi:hypothetical protein